MSNTPITIIGGGISGLSTAWFLNKKGFSVTVLESRPQVGGTMLTSCKEGFLIEHGPNSTLQKPGSAEDALGRLIQSANLEDRLLVANKVANRRYIVRDGLLRPLPTNPLQFMTTPCFSTKAKLRLLLEPFIGKAKTEESIAQFVKRRLGQEFLDYAIEPFISGVYAGDPSTLSVQAAVAKIFDLETKYGSLIRGAILKGRALKGAGMPKGRMISFDKGMSVLPTTLASGLPKGSVRCDFKVNDLKPCENGWEIRGQTSNGPPEKLISKNVILSVPAPMASKLCHSFSSDAFQQLNSIPYAPIATVALGYDRSQVGHALDGFGFLIPRKETIELLGGLFSSTLFPDRADKNKVLITAFIGGAMNREIVQKEDQWVLNSVLEGINRCLHIQSQPTFIHITRYKAAIPQYTLGHLQRIALLDKALQPFPGLHTLANWRDGISVADCVLNAERLANNFND